MGEPFWFRLGREKTVRSPSPHKELALALSEPILLQGGKAEQHPFNGWVSRGLKRFSRGPAHEAKADTEVERRWQELLSSYTAHPPGSWVPQGQPGMERAGVSSYLVCVPQADGAAKGKLPHKQVVHPTKGKL